MRTDTERGSADTARDTMESFEALKILKIAAYALKWGTITVEVRDSNVVMTKVQIDTKN